MTSFLSLQVCPPLPSVRDDIREERPRKLKRPSAPEKENEEDGNTSKLSLYCVHGSLGRVFIPRTKDPSWVR